MGGRHEDDERLVGQGNWLGKAKHNIRITNRCWHMIHILSKEFGLNASSIIELSVRDKYVKEIGPVPEIKYTSGEKAR